MIPIFASRLVFTVFVTALLGLAGCESKPVIPARPVNHALAEVVGEEVARLGGPGAKVMVLAPAVTDAAGMWLEPVLKSLTAQLAVRGNLTVVATQRVKSRLDDPSPTREELTAAQFQGLLADLKGATVVVSFVGFPVLDDAQIAGLQNRPVKFVAVYTAGPQGGPHYQKLLAARVLDVAILPRLEPPPTAAPNATAVRDIFDRQYQLVTPETVGQATF